MVFNTDCFVSLTMGSPCGTSETQCKPPSTTESTPTQPHFSKSLLSRLIAKVLNLMQSSESPSYWSVIAIDQEMNHFEAEILSKSFGLKQPRLRHLDYLMFYHARLVLHLPWMLKSQNVPSQAVAYSCWSALETARAILQIFEAHRTAGVAAMRNDPTKSTPEDALGFLAAATLVIAQMGFAELSQETIAEDNLLINTTLQLYGAMATKLGMESATILQKLCRRRNDFKAGKVVPGNFSIPFVGVLDTPRKISILSMVPNSNIPFHASLAGPSNSIQA
jgi:hypothetical protein